MHLTFHKLAVPILLGCGILATLGREILFANYFGLSRELEIFRVAFSLPNMLSQSLAPAFIGALMPVLVAVERAGHEDYKAFCKRLAGIWTAVVVAISVAGVVTAGLQAGGLAPGFDAPADARLQASLAICWLFFLLMALSFLPRLMLNHRAEFWPGSSTSAVVSLTLIVFSYLAYEGGGQNVERSLALGVVVAGAIILALHTLRERNWISDLVAALRSFGRNSAASGHAIIGPLLAVLALHVVNALPRFVDRAVGSSLEQGTIASLDYSFNILTVPGILLGTSIITVYYPQFVRWVQGDRSQRPGRELPVAVGAAVAGAFLAGIGIYLYSTAVVTLVYGRGAFDAEAISMTATLLGWHGLGLGFMVATMVLFQGCLAYGVYKALLLITLARLAAKMLAIWWFVPQFGLDGLGASFIVPEAISAVLLGLVLFKLCRRDRAS